jgi:hypothetical protein
VQYLSDVHAARRLGDGCRPALWNISTLDNRENYKIDGFRDEDHTAMATFIFSISLFAGVGIARVVVNEGERDANPSTAAMFLTPYLSHKSIHVVLSLSLAIHRIFPCLVSRFCFHIFMYLYHQGYQSHRPWSQVVTQTWDFRQQNFLCKQQHTSLVNDSKIWFICN